jgi:GNAT superfamily N-acetyltransferase
MDNLDNFDVRRLKETHILKPFDCGDSDLNEFFLNDAKLYQKQHLAVTYFEENESQTMFFFSLRNDRISASDTTKWNKIGRNLPNDKRTRKGSYPAVKIGRLGIDKDFQGKGLGRDIMNFIKSLIGINAYTTGAKFLTVDAYKDSIKYYEKNGFDFLTEEDSGEETRAMYFDLIRLVTK